MGEKFNAPDPGARQSTTEGDASQAMADPYLKLDNARSADPYLKLDNARSADTFLKLDNAASADTFLKLDNIPGE